MKTHYHKQKRTALFYLQSLLMAVFFSAPAITHATQQLPQITVYKSPTCGCCTKWINHLEKNGFNVESINRNDMSNLKNEIGIKPELRSCHTAMVDGYYIEGHVPADDIKRLVNEKPEAAGLTVPGMPMGSPGMEGFRKDPYSVILIDKEGQKKVYSKH